MTSNITNTLPITPPFDTPLNFINDVLSIITPEVDPGFTFDTPFDLEIADNGITVNEAIGNDDQGDLYTFQVNEAGEYNLTLDGLSADADLWLLDGEGKEIDISQAYENASESITTELDPGEYYAAVYSYDGAATDYTLNIDSSNDSTTISPEEDTEAIIGTPEDDYLNSDFIDGTENNWFDNLYRGTDDVIDGLAGNDSLYGNGGNDQLFGGEGDDYLAGSTNFAWDAWDYNIGNVPFSDTFSSTESALSFDLIDGEEIPNGVNEFVDDYWSNYDFYNHSFGYIQDEVDTLTGGLGADTFVLGEETGSHYVDQSYTYTMFCDALDCDGLHEGQTNDYAIVTDFSSTEGDVFQVYGDISQYTLETANWTGGEAMDTLIQYGGDTIGVVTDNTDVSFERDFVAVETTFSWDTFTPVDFTNHDISNDLDLIWGS